MITIKTLHIMLAFLTVAGFVLRAGWSFVAPDLLQQKWVRIAPHIIDTLLLVFGVVLALNLSGGYLQPWLGAKLVGLLVYIGFGVMTLRGTGAHRIVGLSGALLAITYIFGVAYTRAVWPF